MEEKPESQITQKPAESAEAVAEIQPVGEKPAKPWLKIFLFSILGIVLAAGLVFAGYKLGQKSVSPELTEIPTPTISPEATPSAGVYSIAGIDLTIDKALRVERKTDDKDWLVLTVTFAANEECPLAGGAVCGYDTRWFRLVNDEGLVQDMLFSYPTIKYLTTNPISQRILKLGEKDKGDVFFEISKEKDKFFLTYSSAGEMTEKIPIVPELFDPTANWKTYTNSKYGYQFKHPPGWIFKAEIVSDETKPLYVIRENVLSNIIDDYLVFISVWDNPDRRSLINWLQFMKDSGALPVPAEAELAANYTVAGGPAFKIWSDPISKGKEPGRCFQACPILDVYFTHRDKAYRVELNYHREVDKESQETFNLLLSTFKFLE